MNWSIHRLRCAQRVVAVLIAVGWSIGALIGTFRDPRPASHNAVIIIFRVGVCVVLPFVVLKRVVTKRMDAMVWAVFALLCFDGIWRASTVSGSAFSAALVALCFLGYGIGRRLDEAAQPGVEPDGPSARGLTP
jgi:hypothetical protein